MENGPFGLNRDYTIAAFGDDNGRGEEATVMK